jgi:glycosyltransferase involved in cell wall biosynthesis
VRVLYVIDSLINAGAETSLVHMAPGYRDLGMDLHVAFLKSRWHVAADLEAAGATLHPVALDQSRPRQLTALVQLIRELKPDVVHTTLYEADVLGRLAARAVSVPSVTTVATDIYSTAKRTEPSSSRVKLGAAQAVDVLTARMASRFHAVSEATARAVVDRLRVPPDRVDVIPRARRRDMLGEPTAERRSAVRAALGLKDATPVVLAIARHEYVKGLDVLMQAVDEMRGRSQDLVVLVAGREGRETPHLRASIAAGGLESTVRLLGARMDVPDLIVAADVVVVPSRVEGMPGAVLEAMALERPVVASDIPMVREAIGDYAFALVPVGDGPALATALGQAVTAPRDEPSSGAARDRFDSRFSPVAVVSAMSDFYGRALATSL